MFYPYQLVDCFSPPLCNSKVRIDLQRMLHVEFFWFLTFEMVI